MSWKPNPNFLRAYKAALGDLASITKKTTPDGIATAMRKSGARIVRNIIDITPPASGKADSAARKRGEGAIVADLLKLAQPVQGVTRRQARELFISAEQLLAKHAAAAKQRGRIARSGGRRIEVDARDFVRVAAILGKRVGWLAAAMNKAAEKLGVSVPAWIKRHGTKYGIAEVIFTDKSFTIRLGQNVPYADNVSGYSRKFDFAFQREVTTLQNMVKAIAAKTTARARARLK